MDHKLEVRNLRKLFNKKVILKEISFEVRQGEFLGILGASGCGKTTLLRSLIGLTGIDGGRIRKDGEDITYKKTAERGMGIVFQNYALFQNMTVLGNVEYALRLKSGKSEAVRKKALHMLDQVGLLDHQNKKPAKLSGGQQQRVAIARSLALNPEIMLFDEPMSALDAQTRIALRKEIKEIQRKMGMTMIYITHDQEEAFAMSDRIMVMDQGTAAQIAAPAGLLADPANAFVESFVLGNLRSKYALLAGYMEAYHEK